MQIVYIKWIDASYQRGECTEDELIPTVFIESAGILVKETEETISIALDYYENDKVWRYIEHIPQVNIRKIKRITIKGDES